MMTDLKTPQEERVLRAYRNMEQSTREYILAHMESLAEMFPDKPPPKLRVVEKMPAKAGASPQNHHQCAARALTLLKNPAGV